MPLPALAIITRIREVLEDGAGAVRVLSAGAYGSDSHAAMSELTSSVGAIGKPQADVTVNARGRHPSSPAEPCSFALVAIEITVRITRSFDGYQDLSRAARDELSALAASDGFDVSQALTWPGNMSATAASSATGLLSERLADAGSAIGSIEFTGGQNGRLVTTHQFTGVCRVETPTA